MSDLTGLDEEIAALRAAADTAGSPGPEPGVRLQLAGRLAARYLEHSGADADKVAVVDLCRAVQADPAATAEQRRRAAVLVPVVLMVSKGPASAFLGADPADPAAFAVALTRSPGDGTAEMAGHLSEVLAALAEIGEESMPPQLRTELAVLRPLEGLIRQFGDGSPPPGLLENLRTAAGGLPAGDPRRTLIEDMTDWLRADGDGAEPGAAAEQLAAVLARVSPGGPVRPVVQHDLARALLEQLNETGNPAGLDGILGLLQDAGEAMTAGHPYRERTQHMLAGALVAAAAGDPDPAVLEEAERAAAALPAGEPGEDALLHGMISILRARAAGGATGRADTTEALRQLVAATEALPAEHPLHAVAAGQLGALLNDRHLLGGLLADGDVAATLLQRVPGFAAAQGDRSSVAYLETLAALNAVSRAMTGEDPGRLPEALADLEQTARALPDGHLFRSRTELVAGVAGLRAALAEGDHEGIGAAEARLRELRNAGTGADPLTLVGASVGDLVHDLLRAGPSAGGDVFARFAETLPGPGLRPDEQVAMLGLRAAASMGRYGTTGDRADGHSAVVLLELAAERLAAEPGHPMRGLLLRDLARARHRLGDAAGAYDTASSALRARAAEVLLQSGLRHALTVARGAAEDAQEFATWCAEDGRPDRMLEMLELGRGLALHAATTAQQVPSLLRGAGHTGLAAEWERQADRQPDDPREAALRIPSDVRSRVLEALSRTSSSGAVLGVPTAGRISAALRILGADALVHPLPGAEAGRLLVLHADGTLTELGAPRLTTARPAPLHGRTGPGEPGRDTLDELCDWAGAAVVQPLLRHLATVSGPGVPRVVLVPPDDLGAVPWPAARYRTPSGEVRRACQDLVVSTTASARLLVDVANRSRGPIEDAPVLVVADPSDDLDESVADVEAVREAFYPGAVLLARDVAATPAAVLARLPGPGRAGASLIYLACHARVSDRPEESYLVLRPEDRFPDGMLRMRDVAGATAGRSPTGPGPVVLMPECATDLSGALHDEALTLSTAMLAAGAVSVVGTRWPVEGRMTALMMFVLHHHLQAKGESPGDALRSAQLWMLDPERQPVRGMPPVMAGDSRAHDLADPRVWAAFAHQGQ